MVVYCAQPVVGGFTTSATNARGAARRRRRPATRVGSGRMLIKFNKIYVKYAWYILETRRHAPAGLHVRQLALDAR